MAYPSSHRLCTEKELTDLIRRSAPILGDRLGAAARRAHVDCEDLLQEAYLRALRHWKTVAPLSPAQQVAWLGRTAGRLLIDELRKPDVGRCEHLTEELAESPDTVNIEADFIVRERYRRVCQVISELPGRPRDVVILYCFFDYDQNYIASMLGIRPSTVAVHLSRARAEIRKRAEGGDDHGR